ncbi:Uncharacterized protein Fot_54202 [Forsythia ovata]|uniref:Uncharacterized protein n=1 Tax=Forsythia ovata TaxID=205694 RepID=A0ABD1PGD9_9LAMI
MHEYSLEGVPLEDGASKIYVICKITKILKDRPMRGCENPRIVEELGKKRSRTMEDSLHANKKQKDQNCFRDDEYDMQETTFAPKGIGELVRSEVTWGEIFRQRRFDSRVGQIFTEILWGSVLGVGLLALSLRSLPLTTFAPKGIGELVRSEVTWGEIFRQRKFDSRVGQIFTEILWESVLGVGLLALSLRSLPLVHISRFTTRLVKGPLTQAKLQLSWVAQASSGRPLPCFCQSGARAVVIVDVQDKKGRAVAESIGLERCSFVHCGVSD